MSCENCGGTMVGDGYTLVRHCENVDVANDLEPDAGPIYCNYSAKCDACLDEPCNGDKNNCPK
ncbi:MAG: hypothetical protein KAS32_03250 [Candidatus Peribacteraceae bacterium]|nr:hypothetical protein [Candidatus Peribacteraceae bacterium]